MKIGFIGLGIMGSRMAANLHKAGHDLVVYNRSQEKADALAAEGVMRAQSAAEVGKQVELLFTMLAHPEAVAGMALGTQGFLDQLHGGSLWVDCSTVNPTFTRRMAQEAQSRGIRFIDSPVAGSKGAAANAELTFIAGGDETDFQQCKPLFDVMGSRAVHVGPNGMGTSVKNVLNLMLALSMASFAEGLVLGEALGISQETLFGLLIGSPVVAPVVERKKAMIEANDYDTEFPLQWMQKDLQMAAVAAFDAGAALPLGNAAKEVYRLAMQSGFAEHDFAAIYSFLKGNKP